MDVGSRDNGSTHLVLLDINLTQASNKFDVKCLLCLALIHDDIKQLALMPGLDIKQKQMRWPKSRPVR